jgi:hypothetical protein
MKKIMLCVIASSLLSAASAQLTVQNGATITTANNAIITLQNIDLQNNGSISQSAGNGKFIFNGTSDNTISGSSNPLFDILEIAKTGGAKLLLGQNVAIGSNIIFTSGIVNLKNNNFLLQPTAALTGENETSHAMDDATNSGQIAITQNIPITTNVNPGNLGVEINTSTTPPGNTTITRYCGVVNLSGNSSGLIQRYYRITPTVNSGLNTNVKFYYLNSELNGVDPATAVLWKSTNNGITWSSIVPDVRNTSTKYLQKNAVSDFSLWTIGAVNSVLPVVVSSFNSTCTGNGASLQWTTQTELNAVYFIIERSIDGIHWDEITRIPTNGIPSDYNFKDNFSGLSFYRLKQVDNSGRFTYSSVLKNNCGIQNISILLYPNPAHEYTNLIFNSENNLKSSINIFDFTGALVKTIQINIASGNNSIRVNLIGLPAGTYFIKLKEKTIDISQRVIIN